MEYGLCRQGSESQDSDEPAPPGTMSHDACKRTDSPSTSSPALLISSKGVENAKKRLRAFSIQKKAPITPVPTVKPVSTGNTTVLIGKLSSVKVGPKPDRVDDDQKKPPKPPKPGGNRRFLNESYTDLQRKTLSEIEDMKRKMELVELGIPLGLICPSTNALPCKAMPTKAMPPIKTFLDSAKVDEIIREAKKAKAEGKEFKFDYQKFVPDYDNPFQRKKDLPEQEKRETPPKEEYKPSKIERDRNKERRKSDRYEKRQDYKKEDKDKYREKEKPREKDKKESKSKDTDDKSRDRDIKSKDRDDKHKREDKEIRKEKDDKASKDKLDKAIKEADVNLNDYLVCDSWSLDNEDKFISSPQVEERKKAVSKDAKPFIDPLEQLRQSLEKKASPKTNSSKPKIERLQPVIDSFKFEIDPNDEEILDIFDEDSDLEKYASKKSKKDTYDSPSQKRFDYDRENKDGSNDGIDDTFLESVINEIKQENMSDDESHDKGLVEYDESPVKDSKEPSIGSVTPELDDKARLQSQRSDYSDGYRSTDSRKSYESFKSNESGYKSTESGYKSNESDFKLGDSGFKATESGFKSNESDFKSNESGYKSKSSRSEDIRVSVEREMDDVDDAKMSRDTVDSLETWSFVLKICQPLLFRHDKNKCYKETRTAPTLWYTQNPKMCTCVKDRSVVYEELEMCKMGLVDRLYGCDPISNEPTLAARAWYPRIDQCLIEHPRNSTDHLASEWDIDESHMDPLTPERHEEVSLDREYQRFMEAVSWPEVSDTKQDSRSTTPVRQDSGKKKAEDKQEEDREEKKKAKKMKLSSEGWSQESDVEEEKIKPVKVEKLKKVRKRKHSISTISSSDEEVAKKRKKTVKNKDTKKSKSKSAKRLRIQKKILKKLKDKKKKKKEEESDAEEEKREIKKREKKAKKKKQQKLKKKNEKKKKRAKSSSSSDSSSRSDSSSESDSESDRKAKRKKKEAGAKKKKKEKKKKRKQSTSDSTSEDLFDVNILNNIKTERLTDDEKKRAASPAPTPTKHREIINVKELQDDFSSTVQIKQEAEEELKRAEIQPKEVPEVEQIEKEEKEEEDVSKEMETDSDLINRFDLSDSRDEQYPAEPSPEETVEFKEPDIPTPPPRPDETSQCSSQESVSSLKEYEKDESHLRPSSQNSNYCFNDVMASQNSYKLEDKFEGYENYEMYEQLAMEYQSDVASQQQVSPVSGWSGNCQRIETVVRARRGEIKCDWRAGDSVGGDPLHHRPSRWGLKPGEVNIVLTGGTEPEPHSEPEALPVAPAAPQLPQEVPPVAPITTQPVYKIQSLANRTENVTMDYDEAYMDMYGASDRLQYGDCFAAATHPAPIPGLHADTRSRSLDDRISQALRDTVLGEVAKDDTDKDGPEKGILVTKVLSEARVVKRVSFADGYKPGQDSDVEEPPVKKRKKSRRLGCAWPCPATHPDHVPLWDALPPPPPPAGSPPPPTRTPPPLHLLRHPAYHKHHLIPPLHHPVHKFDPSVSIPNFMPPEPPPGLISFP